MRNRQPAPTFKKGDRALYDSYHGPCLPGTIVNVGEKDGEKVYDITLDNGDKRWGHPEQFEAITC